MSEPTPKIFQTGAMKVEPGLSAVSTSIVFTTAFATDIATAASAHGLTTGDAIQVSTSEADLPDPLVIDTEYFAIVIDATTFYFATTYALAIAGTQINIADDGTGTHTMEIWTVPTDGWGGATGVQTLGANDAFPWLNFGNKVAIAKEEDESITTRAFKTTPRIIGKSVTNPLTMYARYKSINRFMYWMWGFENEVMEVVVCRAAASPFSASPTIGEVGVDTHGVPKDFTFLRTEVLRDGTNLYIFRTDDSAVVTGTTITHEDWTFTLTSASAIMYEHIYEIDSLGRRLRFYTAAERAVLTSLFTTDKRNLMATFAKRTTNYDLRYQNAMCKNFMLKMTAAGLSQWDSNYAGYTEARGDYDSADWTLLTGLADGSLVPAHFEYKFGIGVALSDGGDGVVSGLTELGMSDVSFEVEVPQQEIQDTISGLSFAEPVLNGKYSVKCTGTISRHTVQTYQTYRDAGTEVVAHMIANQGNYMQEIMMKEATINESGGDDADVMAEPLLLDLGFVVGTSEWSEFMYGVTELHDSPAVLRIRDDSSVNEMTLN